MNELPVYSSFGHFCYAFTCVCPVSQYLFVYYATDVGTATYLDFCNAIVTEVRMRLRRSPTVLYSDGFSTLSQQFEVALAYSEFGIEHLEAPPEMHWLNGIAENTIRVLNRKTRINLSQLIGIVVNGVKIRDPHKQLTENQEKPRWLVDAIAERDKAMAAEERKLRKAANLKTPSAAAAGEPPDWSDDGLAYHEPKPSPKSKPWDPMNRKVGEEPPPG